MSDKVQAVRWWRYFAAFGSTLALLFTSHMTGHMDGPTFANAAVWLFGALAGGGAAAKVAKGKAGG